MTKGIIASNQIYFRPLNINDIDIGWLDWINDKSNNKYLMSQNEYKRDDLIVYLNESKPPSVYMFAVCLVESGKYIGNARLSNFDWSKRRADYGRLIGNHNLKGKGIGTEVLMLLSYYAFYYLRLESIHTLVFAKNIASVKSNQKAGAICENFVLKPILNNNIFEERVAFKISKDSFIKKSIRSKLGIN
jgi:[ribosomal protein S5]-alanine N-acetyltransferase